MNRLSNAQLQDVANKLAPRFSACVRNTGQLTDEQMLQCVADARSAGEQVPKIHSDRSLRLVNHYFVEGPTQS